jgi:hypothetical protein
MVAGAHVHATGLYYKMQELALKYGVSWHVIEETILRSVLAECYGFKCDHGIEKIGMRRDGSNPHCKWCWRFVEITQTSKTNVNAFGRVQETRPMKFKITENQFEDDLRQMLKTAKTSFDQRGLE